MYSNWHEDWERVSEESPRKQVPVITSITCSNERVPTASRAQPASVPESLHRADAGFSECLTESKTERLIHQPKYRTVKRSAGPTQNELQTSTRVRYCTGSTVVEFGAYLGAGSDNRIKRTNGIGRHICTIIFHPPNIGQDNTSRSGKRSATSFDPFSLAS